ncbi:glutathione S-transferase C-terminal domain-containing protein [Streptomyces sp. NPDC001340]
MPAGTRPVAYGYTSTLPRAHPLVLPAAPLRTRSRTRTQGDTCPPHPRPPCPHGAGAEIEAVEHLCEYRINAAAQHAGQADTDAGECQTALTSLLRALGSLEGRLAFQDFILGDEMTTADVQLWVTLVQIDIVHRLHLDAAAVHRIVAHPHLWACARRLAAHPAFGRHLDLDGITRRHHAHCRGLEAAGAAVQILDWAVHIADGAAAQPCQEPLDGFMEPQHALHLPPSGSV